MANITCSCGTCVWARTSWAYINLLDELEYDFGDFCPHCGDKLLPDGTVEVRSELEAKANAPIDWSDCPYCAYNEKVR